ncbi:MAG: hypothetical protein WC516_05470 [Patescibacteria group bacterium]|jgi:hypothetical protein
MVKQKINYNIIKIGQFSVFHIFSNPERVESKIVFDRDNISQKFIFTLMNISHNHGFSCSAPKFNGPTDPTMTFYVGTVLPTKKSLNKYIKKIYDYLVDIKIFATNFNEQFNFDKLDLTMFTGIDLYDFYPEQIAAIRDQHFNGSWSAFKKSLLAENKEIEAEMIERCKKFEKVNKKDIGLVGHKLMVELINGISSNKILN